MFLMFQTLATSTKNYSKHNNVSRKVNSQPFQCDYNSGLSSDSIDTTGKTCYSIYPGDSFHIISSTDFILETYDRDSEKISTYRNPFLIHKVGNYMESRFIGSGTIFVQKFDVDLNSKVYFIESPNFDGVIKKENPFDTNGKELFYYVDFPSQLTISEKVNVEIDINDVYNGWDQIPPIKKLFISNSTFYKGYAKFSIKTEGRTEKGKAYELIPGKFYGEDSKEHVFEVFGELSGSKIGKCTKYNPWIIDDQVVTPEKPLCLLASQNEIYYFDSTDQLKITGKEFGTGTFISSVENGCLITGLAYGRSIYEISSKTTQNVKMSSFLLSPKYIMQNNKETEEFTSFKEIRSFLVLSSNREINIRVSPNSAEIYYIINPNKILLDLQNPGDDFDLKYLANERTTKGSFIVLSGSFTFQKRIGRVKISVDPEQSTTTETKDIVFELLPNKIISKSELKEIGDTSFVYSDFKVGKCQKFSNWIYGQQSISPSNPLCILAHPNEFFYIRAPEKLNITGKYLENGNDIGTVSDAFLFTGPQEGDGIFEVSSEKEQTVEVASSNFTKATSREHKESIHFSHNVYENVFTYAIMKGSGRFEVQMKNHIFIGKGDTSTITNYYLILNADKFENYTNSLIEPLSINDIGDCVYEATLVAKPGSTFKVKDYPFFILSYGQIYSYKILEYTEGVSTNTTNVAFIIITIFLGASFVVTFAFYATYCRFRISFKNIIKEDNILLKELEEKEEEEENSENSENSEKEDKEG